MGCETGLVGEPLAFLRPLANPNVDNVSDGEMRHSHRYLLITASEFIEVRYNITNTFTQSLWIFELFLGPFFRLLCGWRTSPSQPGYISKRSADTNIPQKDKQMQYMKNILELKEFILSVLIFFYRYLEICGSHPLPPGPVSADRWTWTA